MAEEVLKLDPVNNHAMSELLGIWMRQKDKEKCEQRFIGFIDQPKYYFSRESQAPVYRFFRCCKVFDMKEQAKTVYERFESRLDAANLEFYGQNFK
jgi:hypothetical protein